LKKNKNKKKKIIIKNNNKGQRKLFSADPGLGFFTICTWQLQSAPRTVVNAS